MSKIGTGQITQSISNSNKSLVLFLIIMLAGSIGINILRWILLLSVISKIKKVQASMIYFAGQITNEILPTGSGEFVRAHFVKKLDSSSYGKPLGALMVERTMDTILLLLIAIIGVHVVFSDSTGSNIAIIFSLFFVLLALLLFIRPGLFTSLISVIQKINFGFFPTIFVRIREIANSFEDSIGMYQNNKKILIFTFILTAIAWSVEALAQLIMLNAFHYSVTFQEMLWVIGLSWIIGTFSFIPGGLGAREVTSAYLLHNIGVPLTIGLTVSLVYRACIYLEFGIPGGISLVRLTK